MICLTSKWYGYLISKRWRSFSVISTRSCNCWENLNSKGLKIIFKPWNECLDIKPQKMLKVKPSIAPQTVKEVPRNYFFFMNRILGNLRKSSSKPKEISNKINTPHRPNLFHLTFISFYLSKHQFWKLLRDTFWKLMKVWQWKCRWIKDCQL